MCNEIAEPLDINPSHDHPAVPGRGPSIYQGGLIGQNAYEEEGHSNE